MNNPNDPATNRQTFALWCLTKQDYRNKGLTKQAASDLIAKLKGEKGISSKGEVKQSDDQKFAAIHEEALLAANAAHKSAVPVPMVVGTPTTLFGNEIDRNKPVYLVSDGVCGFAYAIVRDARRPFAKWLIKTENGRYSSYERGVCVSDRSGSQSLERKERWVAAYISVLSKHGIDKVYPYSRLD